MDEHCGILAGNYWKRRLEDDQHVYLGNVVCKHLWDVLRFFKAEEQKVIM